MRYPVLCILLFASAVQLFSGCALIPKGDNAEDKREVIQKMKNETLGELYALHPKAKSRIQRAEGYAVFSNLGVNVIYLSAGGGFGLAHDNRTNKEYYMRMVTGGVGLGLGIKDYRGIFVFKSREAFTGFVEKGWAAGVGGDIVAKSEDKGGGAGGAIPVAPDIDLYQLTKSGLAIQATIQGTKYYLDDDLN